MIPMDNALANLKDARKHTLNALEELETRRESLDEIAELQQVAGDLLTIVERWERERARWQ